MPVVVVCVDVVPERVGDTMVVLRDTVVPVPVGRVADRVSVVVDSEVELEFSDAAMEDTTDEICDESAELMDAVAEEAEALTDEMADEAEDASEGGTSLS